MSDRHSNIYEELAIVLLNRILQMQEAEPDALPPAAIKHCQAALKILRKRRHTPRPEPLPKLRK